MSVVRQDFIHADGVVRLFLVARTIGVDKPGVRAVSSWLLCSGEAKG